MRVTPRGIRYYSYCDISGYGQAAIANVRAFVNAGIPLQWTPLDWTHERLMKGHWTLPDGRQRALLANCGTQGHLADLPALVAATCEPIDYDTVVIHSPPEFWPYGFERGKRAIGVTAWETDRTPAHWLHLLNAADVIVVPSKSNVDALLRSGVTRPVTAIPYFRRHRWCEYAPSDIAGAREDLGIPAADRVFYTINEWHPRKAMPDLIAAFVRAFSADEPVTLLIKTLANGYDTGPLYQRAASRDLATRAVSAAAAALGRAPSRVVLHDEELDGDDIDLIHALGDVYVSLAHGEGWGLGAFDAATFGKPVVMTGWGGQTDFLGETWPGAIPYRLVPTPLMPPDRPSYFPSQRWADADIGAAAKRLRQVFDDPAPFVACASDIRDRIVRDYAEPVLIERWQQILCG